MPWPPQCGLERYDSIAIRIDAVLPCLRTVRSRTAIRRRRCLRAKHA